MSEIFIEEINPVMRQLGYCCGQKRQFTPLVQFCDGTTNCVIARNQTYFFYGSSNSTGEFAAAGADERIYCIKCFRSVPKKGINLSENSADSPK
jgi:E1A/CREB-binding protein